MKGAQNVPDGGVHHLRPLYAPLNGYEKKARMCVVVVTKVLPNVFTILQLPLPIC